MHAGRLYELRGRRPLPLTPSEQVDYDRGVIQAFVVQAALRGMEAVGLERQAILSSAGVAEEQIAPPALVPLPAYVGIWRTALALAGRETFPCEVALHIPFGALGPFDLLMRTAVSVDAAFDALSEFAPFGPVERTRTGARITRARLPIVLGAHARRAGFPLLNVPASVLGRMRRLAPADHHFRVQLALPRSMDRGAFERVLGVPVELGARFPAVIVEAPSCEAPTTGGDAELHAALQVLARSGVLGGSLASVGNAARAVIVAELPALVTTSVCASRLGMSARTMHRRLREESTSFAELLDDVRRDQALRLLKDRTRGLSDIAHAVGFSDQSALTRAFRRWTGMTPGQFRAG